jgi:cyclase
MKTTMLKNSAMVFIAATGLTVALSARQNQNTTNADVSVLPVQGSVYMISGAGGNIALQVGSMGVVVVDTGNGRNSDKVLDAIRKLSDKPLQYVINTHYDPDHTGGNEAIRKAGVTITGANVTGDLRDARDGAQLIAHDNVLQRMSAPTGSQSPTPAGAWPTQTFLKGKKDLYFNDEPIEVIYQPAATTDGDSLVVFRHSDVIVAGDIFVTTSFPLIDIEKGGTVQGTINALNRILEITVPKHEEEGGTYVISGHGRICDEFDVLEYRDMVVIVRDRVRAAIKKGMTLEQVKAAHLTKDYDARYDTKSGLGSADKFIEAVYKSVSAAK